MIIERGKPIKIKGKADPNSTIVVRLEDYMKYVYVDEKGNWLTEFPPTKATAKFNIFLEGYDSTIIISNVRTGRLILLTGDGNLRNSFRERQLYSFNEYKSKRSDFSVFYSNSLDNFGRLNYKSGSWISNIDDSIPEELAYAVALGNEISTKERIPVGIVNLVYPFSELENWLECPDSIEKPEIYGSGGHNNNASFYLDQILDTLILDLPNGIFTPWYDDNYWLTHNLPFLFGQNNDIGPGMIWMRKKIYIFSKYLSSDFILDLGSILGNAEVYFNTSLVKKIDYGMANCQIPIPDSITRPWTNILSIKFTGYDTLDGLYSKGITIYNFDSTFFRDISTEWKIRPLYQVADTILSAQEHYCGEIKEKISDYLSDISFNSVIWYGGLSSSRYTREFYFHLQELFSRNLTAFAHQPDIFIIQYPTSTKDSEELAPKNLDAARYILFQVASNLGLSIVEPPETDYSKLPDINRYTELAESTYKIIKKGT